MDELTPQELATRKLGLAMRTVKEPEKLQSAVGGLWSAYLALTLTLTLTLTLSPTRTPTPTPTLTLTFGGLPTWPCSPRCASSSRAWRPSR